MWSSLARGAAWALALGLCGCSQSPTGQGDAASARTASEVGAPSSLPNTTTSSSSASFANEDYEALAVRGRRRLVELAGRFTRNVPACEPRHAPGPLNPLAIDEPLLQRAQQSAHAMHRAPPSRYRSAELTPLLRPMPLFPAERRAARERLANAVKLLHGSNAVVVVMETMMQSPQLDLATRVYRQGSANATAVLFLDGKPSCKALAAARSDKPKRSSQRPPAQDAGDEVRDLSDGLRLRLRHALELSLGAQLGDRFVGLR